MIPVALDLRDRLVVSVGGGSVATRRVSAFLAEGAIVTVIAPALSEELGLFAAEGAITWLPREYAGPSDLDGAWLVHTATADDAANAAVRQDAQALRVWCVDATSSTQTAAAVLARGSVDLPDGEVTVAVHASGDPRQARRLCDGVTADLADGRHSLQRVRTRREGHAGWVALIGGGPGDDRLLTRRGMELLCAADVVVIDRLAPRAIVEQLPLSVRVVDVGKRPGHHALPQDQINQLLVAEAQAGYAVVRLKGGDPYVLGRGGEERLACEAAGIRVEVVPGVTSAIAVPAAAGIPVTHRGVARAFSVVSAHEELPALPVRGDHTLVLLMGISTLAQNVTALIAAGHDLGCPVAIIERGCTPQQRVTTGTLGTIVEMAHTTGVGNPAVVVIGDVVRLSPDYRGD